MMFYESTNKFYIFTDNRDFIVTTKDRERIKVFRGTLKETKDFINRHPYGMTLAEAKNQEVK